MSILGWLFGKKQIKREIVVNAEKLETRVAVVEDGNLEEFQVEHPSNERLVGSIFKGRIQNLEHDLQAAFVDIGMRKNAFLHYWDMFPDDESRLDDEDPDTAPRVSRRKRYTNEQIAKRFAPGTEIIVQVTKGPIGTKGPRVTASLSIPGRYLVMMPGSCRSRRTSGSSSAPSAPAPPSAPSSATSAASSPSGRTCRPTSATSPARRASTRSPTSSSASSATTSPRTSTA